MDAERNKKSYRLVLCEPEGFSAIKIAKMRAIKQSNNGPS